MDTSTSAYHLMEMAAISGECSPRVLAHLHLNTSYGEKLITRLKKEGHIRTHYKDGLRGYRLTSRGKKLLLAENPARFSFYLSGSSDTNRPRSDIPRRLRLQQASIAYAMLQKAGVEIFRDRKPPLFQPGTQTGPVPAYDMTLPAFYHSREVKELGAEAVKINNSRTTGILLAPECIYAVFCTGGALMKWEYRTELKVKALLSYHTSRGILSGMGGGLRYHPDTPIKALIIGEGMDTALKLMESTGGFQKSYFYLDSSFDFFHYVPDDAAGITMIRLLCSPALLKGLKTCSCPTCSLPAPITGWNMMPYRRGFLYSLLLTLTCCGSPGSALPFPSTGLPGTWSASTSRNRCCSNTLGMQPPLKPLTCINLKGGSCTETDREQKETTDALFRPARPAHSTRLCRRLCIPVHHQLPDLDFIRGHTGERHFSGIP